MKWSDGVAFRRFTAHDKRLAAYDLEDGILDVFASNFDRSFRWDTNDTPTDLSMTEIRRASGDRKLLELFLFELGAKAGIGLPKLSVDLYVSPRKGV